MLFNKPAVLTKPGVLVRVAVFFLVIIVSSISTKGVTNRYRVLVNSSAVFFILFVAVHFTTYLPPANRLRLAEVMFSVPLYSWQMGGSHPTEMLSCLISLYFVIVYNIVNLPFVHFEGTLIIFTEI